MPFDNTSDEGSTPCAKCGHVFDGTRCQHPLMERLRAMLRKSMETYAPGGYVFTTYGTGVVPGGACDRHAAPPQPPS